MNPISKCAWLLVLMALPGCGKSPEPSEPPRLVQTMVIAPNSGGTMSTYSGQVVSRYEGRLGFPLGGTLVAKLVDVGATVRTGQPLARLDPADAKLNIDSAAAQTSAAASVADQQVTDLARARQLLTEGFISQAEFDRQRVAVAQAHAQLRSSQAQQAGVSRQFDYTVLRAERGGVVISFDGDVGQILQAGHPVVVVADPHALEAAITIPEGEIAAFRRAALRVRLWSQPGQGYTGTIRTLSPAANQQTRTFDARVSFETNGDAVPIGATAEVLVTSAVAPKMLRLPVAALTRISGRPAVWVVSGTPARVTPRPVSVAAVQQNAVLLSGNLRAGERVVTAGVHLLHAGDPVRVMAGSGARP